MPLRSALRRFVHDPHTIEGRPRPLAANAYRALVAQELLVARALDALLHERSAGGEATAGVTAVIKTFERPRILRRLVESIGRLYPSLSIVVVDDSRDPVQSPGVRTITMPYDSGVAAGRNEGLRHVETEYALVLDDDIVLFWATRLPAALTLMGRHPEIDIMGGQLVDLPFLTSRPLSQAAGSVLGDRAALLPIGSEIGGLTVCEKVPNFFLARTERLRLVPWDPELKRLEHADFFTRALGVLTTVFNPDLKSFHARTPFDGPYMEKRLDYDADRRRLAGRYGGG
jgi:glycosyltransferase involved in cell wall biosynthesis